MHIKFDLIFSKWALLISQPKKSKKKIEKVKKNRETVQIIREKWAFNKQNVGNWWKDNTVCSFIRHFDVCFESIVCNSNQGRVLKFMCVWVVIKRLAVKHDVKKGETVGIYFAAINVRVCDRRNKMLIKEKKNS